MANLHSFATTAHADISLRKDGSVMFNVMNPDGARASFIIDAPDMEWLIEEYRKYNPQASTPESEVRHV